MARPLIISHSDHQGGAARAALRLHQSLVKNGAESRMLVGTKASGDWRVAGPEGKLAQGWARARPTIDGVVQKLQTSANRVLHSPAWMSGVGLSEINKGTHDVVNLHWTCGGLLSIEMIGRLAKPVVWTMHDMWPFCGTEHYDVDDASARWRHGYLGMNRPDGHHGVDLDRWAWNRKRASWRVPRQVVTPSRWLASCVRQSALMGEWPIAVIPNPLDLHVFKPIDRRLARQVLNLPMDKELVLFGALGGASDPRKGWDLLAPALTRIASSRTEVEGVIFGQSEPSKPLDIGLPIRWFGHVSDDYTLALLYSAADVMVVPSRQENLPQSATEAQACGCPVVGFDVTGLPDAVEHLHTGYLAPELCSESLSQALEWVLTDSSRRAHLSAEARSRALRLWDESVVAVQYQNLFAETARDLG